MSDTDKKLADARFLFASAIYSKANVATALEAYEAALKDTILAKPVEPAHSVEPTKKVEPGAAAREWSPKAFNAVKEYANEVGRTYVTAPGGRNARTDAEWKVVCDLLDEAVAAWTAAEKRAATLCDDDILPDHLTPEAVEIAHLRSERDDALRERDAIKADRDNLLKLSRALRDRPDLGDRAKRVDELIRERDEARETVSVQQQTIDSVIVACGSLGLLASELPAHVAAMRANLAAAIRERDEVRRDRERLDCRYAGEWTEVDGSHCSIDSPCAKCKYEREIEGGEQMLHIAREKIAAQEKQLAAAEAEKHEHAAAVLRELRHDLCAVPWRPCLNRVDEMERREQEAARAAREAKP